MIPFPEGYVTWDLGLVLSSSLASTQAQTLTPIHTAPEERPRALETHGLVFGHSGMLLAAQEHSGATPGSQSSNMAPELQLHMHTCN